MMQIFRYIYLLIFLWFPNDVKASVSFDSSPKDIIRFIYFFKEKGSRNIPLPFSSRISFRTFYDFDLGLCQGYGIYLSRKKAKWMSPPSFKSISTSESYDCKNEATSFVPTFFLCLSKRKEIKKIFERVDLCFDFSLSLFSFVVALLTKDGASFKFFHVPEREEKKDEVGKDEVNIGRPFAFFSFPSFFTRLKGFSLRYFTHSCGPKGTMIISKLYPFAHLFSFSFDILVCSYLSCCIKIPFDIVFFFFFLPFTYFSLKRECEIEKQNIIKNKDVDTFPKSDNEEKLQSIIPLARDMILSLFSFSIGIFDEEGIEE